MGCDIHLFTERKREINGVEKWVNIDRFKISPYGSGNEVEHFELVELYGDRNYRLFSMLANVRNYHNNPVISEPKGFPTDCSDYVNKQKESWEGEGHSHSYLTLHEIKEFRKKHKVTKYSGMMSPENAALVDKGEMPNSWCQATRIPNHVYREWECTDDTLSDLVNKLEERAFEEFWLEIDSDSSQNEHKIRIVFWFDN